MPLDKILELVNKEEKEGTEALVKYFDELLDKAKNYKEAKPYIEKELKSGKLDTKEVTGLIPAIVGQKVKKLELAKAPKGAKQPARPKQPSQPYYQTPELNRAQKAYDKNKKEFNKKVGKALGKWVVTPKEDLT